MRSFKNNEYLDHESEIDEIPTGKIENVLNKYAQEIEQDEQVYKQKLEEHHQQEESKKDKLKAITKKKVVKRPVAQTNLEPIKPLQSESKTRPSTDDDWLYEHRKEEFYVQRNKELQEKSDQLKKEESGNDLGGGFSKGLNNSGRSKRKKWNTNNSNAIVSTNLDQTLNSRAAAQLDKLANIHIESSKQDMVINEMYTQIKYEEEKKKEDLKSHLKTKKDKAERKKPVPNVPKKGLFSMDDWLSQIDGGDPEKLKDNIAKKTKVNARKINAAVERLSKPAKKIPKMDPDQKELAHIFHKYNASERRVGGGAKKKFEYINRAPGSRISPIIPKKSVSFVESQSSNNDVNDQDYSKYCLSNIHEEEEKLEMERKMLDTMLTNKSQLQTNKVSEHNTLVDNAVSEIMINADERTLVQIGNRIEEDKDEDTEFNDLDSDPTASVNNQKVLDNIKFVKEQTMKESKSPVKLTKIKGNLETPIRDSPMRNSTDSLNDRTTMNDRNSMKKDLDDVSSSDADERDIDLGEQYDEMIKGEQPEDLDRDSDMDSLNDVDEDLTNLYNFT
jgi:hypothetical protein